MAEKDPAQPPAAESTTPWTMYLDPAAHLDWDWLQSFEQNFRFYPRNSYGTGGADAILNGAITLLGQDSQYRYTICEMSFLRRFVEEHPEKIAVLQGFGDRFQALSGGITSPDCLVCSGEGFIRNYLVGQSWLRATLNIEPRQRCWLPDDFGQGPELPVLMQALGFDAVAFERIPGGDDGALGQHLTQIGLDFLWPASDGSTVYAHWLKGGYAFGSGLADGTKQISDFVSAYSGAQTPVPPYSAAIGPVMYIPVENDFSMPFAIQHIIDDWNKNGSSTSGVTVEVGTFDTFVSALLAATPPIATFKHDGTPYWTGYYASRPALKRLHYDTVRGLVAAEVFGLLTQPGSPQNMLPKRFWSDLAETWDEFAPSTHHDYVCGTANDAVYAGDQLPRLRGTAARAAALRGAALNALAGMNGGQDAVLVANSLGFERTGEIVELEGVDPPGLSGTTQPSYEGGTLFCASLPSFGYACVSQASTAPSAVTATPVNASVALANEFFTAYIDSDGNLAGVVVPGETGSQLGGTSNTLIFYEDKGGLYQFGSEGGDGGGTFKLMAPQTNTVGITLLETGPLRARLRATTRVHFGDGSFRDYVREYSLSAGEPFLRMTTTGGAPTNCSVMTGFSFTAPVATIDHGTPGHWTDRQPAPTGGMAAPVFRPTQDFLLASDGSGSLRGGVYHRSMPAWAIDENGTLIGCLFRNTPANGFWGAGGSDSGTHTQHYALRIPKGLQGPETGQPLREALAFATPMEAVPTSGQAAQSVLDGSGTLASIAGSGPAILTVAKPGTYAQGDLILRVYQPGNGTFSGTIKVAGTPTSAALVTATETVWAGPGSATLSAGAVQLTMANAMATVRIGGLGIQPAAAEH